ncbi:MAG: hypothetical protein JW966_07565 [Anaerolineae bacterium]|nr:hypothetical protein [Anaerolineae bacterium]
MPDSQLPDPRSELEKLFQEDFSPTVSGKVVYRIDRKGSVYNIFGPYGRVFGKYKSASVVGPRWEELTHTPWPFRSKAYESGLRLWELGIIEREQVGQLKLRPKLKPAPAHIPPKPQPQPRNRVITIIIPDKPILTLPAPKINLAEQVRLIQALRNKPALLFDPQVRQALVHEVEYHRPNARWAQSLLNLLAKFERRQRRRRPAMADDPNTVLAKHIAWQKQKTAGVS